MYMSILSMTVGKTEIQILLNFIKNNFHTDLHLSFLKVTDGDCVITLIVIGYLTCLIVITDIDLTKTTQVQIIL